MGHQRGAILGIVVIIAFICAVSVYSLLFIASSETRRARYFRDRTEAHYVAEAAMVIAREKLWGEAITPYPPGCPPGGTLTTLEPVDTNSNGIDPSDPTVPVTVTNCGAGRVHRLQTKATF